MKMFFENNLKVFSDAPQSAFAAELFCHEINLRTGSNPWETDDKLSADFAFITDENTGRDAYEISCGKDRVVLSASGIRGFIYAMGHVLRKIEKQDSGFSLPDISGSFSPDKSIRGHQLGYRTTPNTYDAWDYEQYDRYCLDLMFFGMNTVEHMPYVDGVSKRNALMKYDEEEFLAEACRMADKYDLNVSLWQPTLEGESPEKAAEKYDKLYSRLSRLDYVFIPGGDPGEMPADEFISLCRVISAVAKKHHPACQMWPSAQAPHSIENWPEVFVRELNKMPDEIDGIIYGPNHAYPLDVLRKKIPEKYPFRFYPDITHNVRCEYPVHYDRDDWHFALASGLGRECTNPRPREYAHLHKNTRDYFIGSVSYSEGITDDVNKAVFSALDYDCNASADEIIADYSRLYFYGTDTDKIASLIFSLEKNWEGDPKDNEGIDETYGGFRRVYSAYPSLRDNWRFLQLLLRADCDKLIRDRRIYELSLIDEAKSLLPDNKKSEAKKVLLSDFSDEYKLIREEIDFLCEKLFRLIGLQTDTEHYLADNWERGAILETIDQPVTDRQWLLSVWDEENILDYFERNKISEGEYYFSVALDGIKQKQQGEPYMNFAGDNPSENDGRLPTALFNVFDNFTYETDIEGLESRDYVLRITYLNKKNNAVIHHKITANGAVIYDGKQFGEIDEAYTAKFCTPRYVAAKYKVPASCIKGGRIHLEFSEPVMGVMFAEFSLKYE